MKFALLCGLPDNAPRMILFNYMKSGHSTQSDRKVMRNAVEPSNQLTACSRLNGCYATIRNIWLQRSNITFDHVWMAPILAALVVTYYYSHWN
jgi:hypothetical protein